VKKNWADRLSKQSLERLFNLCSDADLSRLLMVVLEYKPFIVNCAF
jgi:hypothetical protein